MWATSITMSDKKLIVNMSEPALLLLVVCLILGTVLATVETIARFLLSSPRRACAAFPAHRLSAGLFLSIVAGATYLAPFGKSAVASYGGVIFLLAALLLHNSVQHGGEGLRRIYSMRLGYFIKYADVAYLRSIEVPMLIRLLGVGDAYRAMKYCSSTNLNDKDEPATKEHRAELSASIKSLTCFLKDFRLLCDIVTVPVKLLVFLLNAVSILLNCVHFLVAVLYDVLAYVVMAAYLCVTYLKGGKVNKAAAPTPTPTPTSTPTLLGCRKLARALAVKIRRAHAARKLNARLRGSAWRRGRGPSSSASSRQDHEDYGWWVQSRFEAGIDDPIGTGIGSNDQQPNGEKKAASGRRAMYAGRYGHGKTGDKSFFMDIYTTTTGVAVDDADTRLPATGAGDVVRPKYTPSQDRESEVNAGGCTTNSATSVNLFGFLRSARLVKFMGKHLFTCAPRLPCVEHAASSPAVLERSYADVVTRPAQKSFATAASPAAPPTPTPSASPINTYVKLTILSNDSKTGTFTAVREQKRARKGFLKGADQVVVVNVNHVSLECLEALSSVGFTRATYRPAPKGTSASADRCPASASSVVGVVMNAPKKAEENAPMDFIERRDSTLLQAEGEQADGSGLETAAYSQF